MSKSFIDDARSIVINNIADENFGVRELASSLNLSSSQTLRKVKAATGKSVNQYIRELRLEKAAKLLKTTDYGAAEISYQVGFKSASYFNTTFSKYYGITPGEYRTSSTSELIAKEPEPLLGKFYRTKTLGYGLSVVLLAIIGYVFINTSPFEKPRVINSIAVLPFKDFSPEDNQWFSDGISDNILHSLAQMKDITVTSFTSSSTYRNSDKRIPVIANELGVTYILEGSVTRLDNNVKIIAQLIDSNDQHVWSKEYNEPFEDIISIQNSVAQEVMNQLQVTLSPKETVTLSKHPTDDMEAYSLFLKGRLVNNSRKQADLWQNIELNKQAIALDPKFAEAYAEVAHSYWQLSRYHAFRGINAFEGIDFAHKYADSALRISQNTYRAWGVKAALSEYKDWNKTNSYYKKALALNPNDALTHIQYALYYQFRPNPDIKKYLEHLTIAQQLDPISGIQATNYLNALIYNHKLKEAEEFLEKNKFQFGDDQIRWFKYRLIAYKHKDWGKVIPYLETQLKKYPDSILYYGELAYASNAILNDDSAAVAYMRKSYQIDSSAFFSVVPLVNMLIEDGQYKEAQTIMQSKNYKTDLPPRFQQHQSWYYHYIKGDRENTLEIAKQPPFVNDYLIQVLTYAQLGDRKKVDSINKKHPYGTGALINWRTNRAIMHAVLKDRDSMYFYLKQTQFDNYALGVNERREFDPYRKEERFKDFLRMNYFPVSED